MMDKRRLKNAGLRAGLLEERRKLKRRAQHCLDEIESATFVVSDPLALDGRAVKLAAVELERVLAEAATVQGRLDELEESLGL